MNLKKAIEAIKELEKCLTLTPKEENILSCLKAYERDLKRLHDLEIVARSAVLCHSHSGMYCDDGTCGEGLQDRIDEVMKGSEGE